MDLVIEITRSLYHLDLFRRSFRTINFHHCTHSDGTSQSRDSTGDVSSCIVCSFKDIFNELNLSMRESFLDPPLVFKIIEKRMMGHMAQMEDFNINLKYKGQNSATTPSHSFPLRNFPSTGVQYLMSTPAIYDYIFDKLNSSVEKTEDPRDGEVSFKYSKDGYYWKDILNMKTEYSLTKICFECRTTTHIETVSQYIHQVDSSNLMSNDWPSFEFGLKSALDSVEFCVKPNCHGQTKIFRCLRSFPDIIGLSFTDTTNVSTLHILPSVLRPYLIFESATTTNVILKSVVLFSRDGGYASLFFHSRLKLWIFIDKRQIVSLCATWTESKMHPVLNDYRAIVVFYCHDNDAKRVLPFIIPPGGQIITETLPEIPRRHFNKTVHFASPAPAVVRRRKMEQDRIYENWPVDSDSGLGSNEESSSSGSYTATQRLNTEILFLDGRPESQSNLQRKPSTLSTNSTNSMHSSPDCRGVTLSYGNHLTSDISTENNNEERNRKSMASTSKNKFATIRRKGKHNTPTKPDKNFSISVPDLRSIRSSSVNETSPKSQHSSKFSMRQMYYDSTYDSSGTNERTLYNQNIFSNRGDMFNSIGSPTLVAKNSSVSTKSEFSKPNALFQSRFVGQNNHHLDVPASSQSDLLFLPNSVLTTNYNNLKSAENGLVHSNKKVSFNCEVTLVNDEDDEYIPHPIFQSVLNKLNNM